MAKQFNIQDNNNVPAYIVKKNIRKKRVFNVVDSFISILLIFPIILTYWRSTILIMDDLEFLTPWRNFLIGSGVNILFTLTRPLIFDPDSVDRSRKLTLFEKIFQFAKRKIYNYVFSVFCLMQLVGGWGVVDLQITEFSFLTAILFTATCTISLMSLKSYRNVTAAPFAIDIDTDESVYAFQTRFRIKGSQDPLLYILDCVFSVLVIGTLVVFVWRGMWVLCDLIIYPDDETMTAWGSLAIGYGIVAVTFALQSLMRWACDRLQGFWRVAVADIFLFFSFIGTVNVWRGVWQICDVYFFPENKQLGNILTHVISFLLLALLNCSNSVLVRGVYIDAEEPAGQCVIFPVYYIRLFFQKERTKKQKKLLDALEKLDPHHHNHHHHNNQTGALLTSSEKENTKIIIVPSNNKNSNAAINNKKAIELNAILNDVENINEKQKNLERTILRSNDD